ncbi:MAG: endonuclease III [Clostridiales bacterium]|nr:endonuclease III [Clostridiales bacterium]
MTNEKVSYILNELKKLYPEAECELNFRTPFQLLIAVVLSAQTTDKKVNEVTERLFADYPDLDSMLTISEEVLQERIKKIGLYKTKSKNIMNLCKMLKEQYDGVIPNTFEDLIKLPGVGRKTANVVLSNAFSIPAIAVDTHVFRVSNRIGMVQGKNVLDTEYQLMEKIPRGQWSEAHHMLIWHGRRICKAQNPNCVNCPLNTVCKYYQGIGDKA